MSNKTLKENTAKTVLARKRFNRLLSLGLIIFVLAAISYGLYVWRQPRLAFSCTSTPTGRCIRKLDIADTTQERARGLGGRDDYPSNRAMLFVLDNEDYQGIWMKDMRFSIDIYWLDADKTIISSLKNISPDSYPQVFYPDKPSKYVLEVKTSDNSEFPLRVGDRVSF